MWKIGFLALGLCHLALEVHGAPEPGYIEFHYKLQETRRYMNERLAAKAPPEPKPGQDAVLCSEKGYNNLTTLATGKAVKSGLRTYLQFDAIPFDQIQSGTIYVVKWNTGSNGEARSGLWGSDVHKGQPKVDPRDAEFLDFADEHGLLKEGEEGEEEGELMVPVAPTKRAPNTFYATLSAVWKANPRLDLYHPTHQAPLLLFAGATAVGSGHWELPTAGYEMHLEVVVARGGINPRQHYSIQWGKDHRAVLEGGKLRIHSSSTDQMRDLKASEIMTATLSGDQFKPEMKSLRPSRDKKTIVVA